MKKHQYKALIEWCGNLGVGTKDYKSYSRDHTIHISGKYDKIQASSDASFRGTGSKYNPEELFLSSLSNCHMLWYLHLCTVNQVVVVDYSDEAAGVMIEENDGSGKFTEVRLNPKVTVEDLSMVNKARQLHEEANKMCFIANSCNFKIDHFPTVTAKQVL